MSTQIQAFLKTHIFIPICDRSPGKRFPNNTVSVCGFLRELKQRAGRWRRQRERETSKGLDKQNNNFACASRLFVHSFAVVARLRLESTVPNFTFCGGRKHKTTIFFFSSWTLMQSFRIHLQQKSPTSVTLKLGEIDAVKFETERKFTLSPKSDQHQICPCNINAFYDRVVMRITDMITRDEFTWYFINFSPLLLRKWIGTTSENSNFDLRV